MKSRTIALIAFLMSTVGWLWVLAHAFVSPRLTPVTIEVCLFKKVTGIPCPSCGTTRSAVFFIKGDFLEALQCNPLGVFMLIAMTIIPVWVLVDVATRKTTFYRFYRGFETTLQRRGFYITGIVMVLALWAWVLIQSH